jgi:hypothetical protein
VSPATSKTYVSRLLAKLDARDRAQLVAIAYETGLVTPGAGWAFRAGPGRPREWAWAAHRYAIWALGCSGIAVLLAAAALLTP